MFEKLFSSHLTTSFTSFRCKELCFSWGKWEAIGASPHLALLFAHCQYTQEPKDSLQLCKIRPDLLNITKINSLWVLLLTRQNHNLYKWTIYIVVDMYTYVSAQLTGKKVHFSGGCNTGRLILIRLCSTFCWFCACFIAIAKSKPLHNARGHEPHQQVHLFDAFPVREPITRNI